MLKPKGVLKTFYCLVFVLCLQLTARKASGSLNYEGSGEGGVGTAARVVKKEERTPVVATEFGSISAVDIDDGFGRNEYHLQFITMEPNALFLPVLLHADMAFYVHTGSGRLSWTEGDDINKVSLQRGDVYRLKSGTLFYLHSNVEPERSRFRIIAMFSNHDEQLLGPPVGPYSSVTDLVRGFDKPVLQAAFQVPEEVIDELTSTTETPAIVEGGQKSKKKYWEEELIFINTLFGIQRLRNQRADNKKKHTKTFNIYKEDPDFKNCHGWSKVVTKHDLHALHGSQIGVFMVNLSKGSIMGPHWNPTATEVSVVIEGEGMVQVVCPSALANKECKNSRIRVEEGDVLTVPRFHPMAQTSFNNGSLVFMGFSTASKKNHPQFLAGKASVLQTLDKFILGVSFNVSNTTVGQLLAAQKDSIILDCTSCAEEQEIVMEKEIEKERREEEEAARKREEEEKKRREEEERRRREEEERKRREEEAARRREEEEKKRQEEEEKKRQEEEEKRRREEEEEKRKQEEEERKRREEEERKREEEEAARRRDEEEKRKQEEEEWKRQEEEEMKRKEEEERKREEEAAAKRRQKEEERKREEEAKRREEEERKREEEEAKKREQEKEEEKRQQEEEKQRQKEQEEERQREQEEERQREEESRRRQEKEQKKRDQEEEQRRQQEEEEKRQQEEQRQQEEDRKEEQRRQEEEQQRQQEEEQQRQQEEEREKEQRRQEEEQRQQEEQQRRQEEWEERQRQEKEQRKKDEEEKEQRKRDEEQRQREEKEQRKREEEQRKKDEKEQRKRDEEERRRKEERERGEGESEEEMARREEEERIERQREQEEGGRRWGDIKLKSN